VWAVEKPVIYFGVIPRYNPMIMYQNYQPIMDYLTEKTSYRFELKLTRDYTEAVELLKTGAVQLASLGDVTFFEANRGFGAVPIVRPLNKLGRADYRSIIITRKDAGITSLAELRGKSFAFGNLHSTSGNLIPRLLLYKNGITLFDLGFYENLATHTAVARAVLKGTVDAGAVKDVVAYRYQPHGLTFLAVSDPIPSVPIVARPDTEPILVEAVRKALLAIDASDPVMIKRMQNWDPEFRNGFVSAAAKDYAPIFEMMESVPEGCGRRCH
ncbi:MAG: phosphate/phosphite/phosphonate ABC transporter substrate-binding protein, partial [Deltaproteobacteria bacterium]|nr:phosphate/phosphite/phosphonate ABC transporter substrate-binding protein [Deltaproteobacteria bacterium]